MTSKQRAYQVSLLRRLHTAPRYVNLYKDDKIAYHAWLKKHLGVNSSKELKLNVLIGLVEYFEMKRDTPPTNKATNQQIGYIRHLWSTNATYKYEGSLLRFIERTLTKRLTAVEDLTPVEASKVIAGVKQIKPKTIPSANNPNYKGKGG